MARTNDLWETINGGTAIQTIAPNGYDLLINGLSKYLNFNSVVGTTGYGIRDNGGVIQVKNSGGAWANIGVSGGLPSELVATGTINGSNTVFTFVSQPQYIISDGAWYKVNVGWTWNGIDTATMTIPPNDNIWGF